MADLVPAADIERIVGMQRHPTEHWGRAVSTTQKVYILHSQECIDDPFDLRDCEFSTALDQGIEPAEWVEDTTVRLGVRSTARRDWLVPATAASGDSGVSA